MNPLHDSELKLCGLVAGMLPHETVRGAVMRVVAERDRYRAALQTIADENEYLTVGTPKNAIDLAKSDDDDLDEPLGQACNLGDTDCESCS